MPVIRPHFWVLIEAIGTCLAAQSNIVRPGFKALATKITDLGGSIILGTVDDPVQGQIIRKSLQEALALKAIPMVGRLSCPIIQNLEGPKIFIDKGIYSINANMGDEEHATIVIPYFSSVLWRDGIEALNQQMLDLAADAVEMWVDKQFNRKLHFVVRDDGSITSTGDSVHTPTRMIM